MSIGNYVNIGERTVDAGMMLPLFDDMTTCTFQDLSEFILLLVGWKKND